MKAVQVFEGDGVDRGEAAAMDGSRAACKATTQESDALGRVDRLDPERWQDVSAAIGKPYPEFRLHAWAVLKELRKALGGTNETADYLILRGWAERLQTTLEVWERYREAKRREQP